MASETDTAEIIMLTPVEMRWLYHALGSFHARSNAESKCRATFRDTIMDMQHGNLAEYAVPFTAGELMVARWAAEDGRCRDDERLVRGRLRERFDKAMGVKGASDSV